MESVNLNIKNVNTNFRHLESSEYDLYLAPHEYINLDMTDYSASDNPAIMTSPWNQDRRLTLDCPISTQSPSTTPQCTPAPKSLSCSPSSCSPSPSLSPSSISPSFPDGDAFFQYHTMGDQINKGGFGTVYYLKGEPTKCVKVMHIGRDQKASQRRQCIISEYHSTKHALEGTLDDHVRGITELYLDDMKNDDIVDPKGYLIIPYFNGRDLYDIIGDEHYAQKMTTDAMLDIFYQILQRLFTLHYVKHIVHGDLKPENVMILQNDTTSDTMNGSKQRVELIDYGVAKSTKSLLHEDEYLECEGPFGTKGYIAPEILQSRHYNNKADVFSAGVVLYNIITGSVLFPSDIRYEQLSQRDYYQYLSDALDCIDDDDLLDLLWSCLAYDTAERLSVQQIMEKYFDRPAAVDSVTNVTDGSNGTNATNANTLKREGEHTQCSESAELQIEDTHDLDEDTDNTTTTATTQTCTNGEIAEELVWHCNGMKAWQWNEEQEVWDHVGGGEVGIFCAENGSARIVFMEDDATDYMYSLHDIDGQTFCEMAEDTPCEVRLDTECPVVGGYWKLLFADEAAANQFVEVFIEMNHQSTIHHSKSTESNDEETMDSMAIEDEEEEDSETVVVPQS